jgi:hypothetical protein
MGNIPNAPIAVLDGCVLYPAPLRDLLMHLAVSGAYRPRWTDRIHDEWTRHVLRNRPDLSADQLRRTRELMNLHAGGSLVVGYEPLIDRIPLPDADDRHVLAAAIQSGATEIVTFNRRDFPAETLRPLAITAVHPDAFVLRLFDRDRDVVIESVRRQRALLKRPPQSVEELLQTFERQSLLRSVEVLRQCIDQL